MEPRQSDAIRLVESLSDAELDQLAVGHRHLIYEAGRFRLADPHESHDKVLFEGGQEWLESHVPHQQRKGQELRRYIVDYIDDIFEYVVDRW